MYKTSLTQHILTRILLKDKSGTGIQLHHYNLRVQANTTISQNALSIMLYAYLKLIHGWPNS